MGPEPRLGCPVVFCMQHGNQDGHCYHDGDIHCWPLDHHDQAIVLDIHQHQHNRISPDRHFDLDSDIGCYFYR